MSRESDRLLECFNAGLLVRPSADVLNFTDLTRALLRLGGAQEIPEGNGVDELERLIGPADHYVFVLVDGLGVAILESLPVDSFLRSHMRATLQAVFPATTAAALTTLATAAWPASHGLPGWWIYLPERALSITPLPFVERFSEEPLGRRGVEASEVFTVPSAWSRLTHSPLTVICASLTESVYTTYTSGRTPRRGYERIGEAVDIALERLASATGKTLTYVYLPHVDLAAHDHGTRAEQTRRAVRDVEAALSRLACEVAGKARVIITADHGLADTPRERNLVLEEGNALLTELLCPPTGDPSMLIFHAREGRAEAAKRAVAESIGEHFALITPEEAQEMQLFGPEPLSAVTRARLGDFTGIALHPSTVWYNPAGVNFVPLAAGHSGLTPSEMIVPLILA